MSRPQVTITLGRSGQVVKRAGNALNNSQFDSTPLLGNKRSIRDRLGGSADTEPYQATQPNLKRQRGGSSELCSYGAPDLRVKLIQKTKARQAQSIIRKQSHADLQNMIWKRDNSPASACTMQCMPNPKAEAALTLKRIPHPRSADDILHLESAGKSFSPWNRGESRYKSPEKKVQGSMGVSLPQLLNHQPQVAVYRSTNTQRVSPFVGRNAYNHGGPQYSAPSITRVASPLEASVPFHTFHSQSSISQMGQEPLTVGSFLNSLGLGKYAVLFQAEEIDMAVLKQMRDNDLKEMGIPMGPRRKILLALLSRSRHHRIEL